MRQERAEKVAGGLQTLWERWDSVGGYNDHLPGFPGLPEKVTGA